MMPCNPQNTNVHSTSHTCTSNYAYCIAMNHVVHATSVDTTPANACQTRLALLIRFTWCLLVAPRSSPTSGRSITNWLMVSTAWSVLHNQYLGRRLLVEVCGLTGHRLGQCQKMLDSLAIFQLANLQAIVLSIESQHMLSFLEEEYLVNEKLLQYILYMIHEHTCVCTYTHIHCKAHVADMSTRPLSSTCAIHVQAWWGPCTCTCTYVSPAAYYRLQQERITRKSV